MNSFELIMDEGQLHQRIGFIIAIDVCFKIGRQFKNFMFAGEAGEPSLCFPDKPEVVWKVLKEWNQLQAEIAELEKKIEATDKEIDQMAYALYGLTGDEMKIVEQEKQQ